jgi:hypothetical protein
MRREFSLPSFDVSYLRTTGLAWETIKDVNGSQWLLLHERPVAHAGYSPATTTLALQIPSGYPDAQIDMAYFFPPLARSDGGQISALATVEIDGKGFQRWSRHRTGDGPWRPGEDDLSTHLVLVDDWLERELAKP